MNKKYINIIVLLILILFLIIVCINPVNCIFKQFTGINCPSCGMTRAFHEIFNLNFFQALYQNILSIPLFVFIIFLIPNLFIDIIKNRFIFIPKLFSFFSKTWIIIIILLIISFIFNNIKNLL